MNKIYLAFLTCFTFYVQLTQAAVIAGSFEWTSTSGVHTETSTFTYNTDTHTGQIEDLYYPDSGTWVGGTLASWNFRLGVAGQSLINRHVIVNTFSDLTDFTVRPIELSPGFSFGGQSTPSMVEGQLVWYLRRGGGYGALDTNWYINDGGIPSSSFRSGTASNFTEAIPEPGISFFTLVGAMLIFGIRRHR